MDDAGIRLLRKQRPPMTDGDLEKGTVKQSHAIQRAAARLSLDEKRLISAAISRLNMKFAEKEIPAAVIEFCEKEGILLDHLLSHVNIRISAREFGELFDIKSSNAYAQLKNAYYSLKRKHIALRAGGDTRVYDWIYDGGYNDGLGYVDLILGECVVTHCSAIDQQFTLFPLSSAGQLKRDNSWKIYGLLARYRDTGVVRMSISEFCDEIDAPPSYIKPSLLKKNALDPAIDELKERLKLRVTYKMIKVGRSFEKIEIFFDPENWKQQQPQLSVAEVGKYIVDDKANPEPSPSENKENKDALKDKASRRKEITSSIMNVHDVDW